MEFAVVRAEVKDVYMSAWQTAPRWERHDLYHCPAKVRVQRGRHTFARGRFWIACDARDSNRYTSVKMILSSSCFNSFRSDSVIDNACRYSCPSIWLPVSFEATSGHLRE